MDIKGGKILWRHPMRSAPGSAALTTAGGLAIVGDSDRYLYVDDVVTGKNLYRTRLSASVTGFPMTYAVQGRQYLAVPVGTRGAAGGNAMYVFAVPERAAISRR
jgi:alcohol dehydrogenase (cytochrome c)